MDTTVNLYESCSYELLRKYTPYTTAQRPLALGDGVCVFGGDNSGAGFTGNGRVYV